MFFSPCLGLQERADTQHFLALTYLVFFFCFLCNCALQFALALLSKAFFQNRSFQADAIGPKAGVRKVQSQTTVRERNMFDRNVVIPLASPVPIILIDDVSSPTSISVWSDFVGGERKCSKCCES